MYRQERCRGCGACVAVCPLSLQRMQEGHVFDRTGCRECGLCSEACTFGAFEMVGQEISVQEIVSELKNFYAQSCGGVTVSGGETMMQPEFTKALLR